MNIEEGHLERVRHVNTGSTTPLYLIVNTYNVFDFTFNSRQIGTLAYRRR